MADPVFSTTLQLPAATAKDGTEVIEVIQGGASKQMPLPDALVVDKYNLAHFATTGACDLSKYQSFLIDLSAAGAKTVTFTNAPAGRSMTIVFKIKGKVGTITWPAGITWNESTAPEFGTNNTIVVLFWDGTNYIGARGAVN